MTFTDLETVSAGVLVTRPAGASGQEGEEAQCTSGRVQIRPPLFTPIEEGDTTFVSVSNGLIENRWRGNASIGPGTSEQTTAGFNLEVYCGRIVETCPRQLEADANRSAETPR